MIQSRLKTAQTACTLVALLGVIILGIEIFANDSENITVMRVCSAATYIGLAGNFAASLALVCLEFKQK